MSASPEAIESWRPMCRGLALKLLDHQHDAEDAASEAVMRTLACGRAPEDHDDLGGWMSVSARNAAINLIRWRRVQRKHFTQARNSLGQPLAEAAADYHRDDATETDERQRRARVLLTLDRLLPQHRAVLAALYLEERPAGEVCAELGMQPSAFRQLVFRARRKFREAWGRVRGAA